MLDPKTLNITRSEAIEQLIREEAKKEKINVNFNNPIVV